MKQAIDYNPIFKGEKVIKIGKFSQRRQSYINYRLKKYIKKWEQLLDANTTEIQNGSINDDFVNDINRFRIKFYNDPKIKTYPSGRKVRIVE